LNEARAAAALKGEHIARVHDFGQLPSGEPYLVMEHLEGMGLDAFLAERGPLAQAEAVDILLQACEGLAEAHAASLVHRDIKAANLFLVKRPDGQFVLKILDFGIAKRLVDGALRGVTNPKTSVGSPWYMPPEQMLDSTTVDQRADVWSLGVLLYELLTGEYPFDGDGVVQICANVLTAPTPSVRAVRPEIDARLDAVFQRCLEKNMERRFGSVLELADALRPFGSRPVQAGSPLAPSEGLNLEGASAEAIPIHVDVPLERWPSEPIVSAAPAPHESPVESWVPITVHRRRRFTKRSARERSRGRSTALLVGTALLAATFGVALSWFGFPYVSTSRMEVSLQRLAAIRLPFYPALNPGPDVAPLERNLPVSEFMSRLGQGERPMGKARLARGAASASPVLTPEEAQRRAERYARWLREQGLTPLRGEWTTGHGGEPKRTGEE
jgi:serine/threonine protein kinase